jgi:hypothetical protein
MASPSSSALFGLDAQLHQVATLSKPDLILSEDVFAVAVLQHDKHPATCVPEDFSWFKLKAVCCPSLPNNFHGHSYSSAGQ